MPQLIEYIDAIARKKQRDVLFIQFRPVDIGAAVFEYDYRKDKRRKKVLTWLNKNNINWKECAPAEGEFGCSWYRGEVYIDVPYNEEDPQYQLVRDYLENPDGSLRDKNVQFYYVPLEFAMNNIPKKVPDEWYQ